VALAPSSRLAPPHDVATLGNDGLNGAAWREHHQEVADRIADQATELTDQQTQLTGQGARITTLEAKRGVTDGSDAAPGQIGEYLTASGSGISLTSNTTATVATLTLTAGDWEIYGGVTFHLSGATTTHYAAGLDGTFGTEIIATVPAGSGVWQLQAGTVRRNVTGTTAVLLQGLCGFSAGSVSADGTIRARRMR